MECKKCGHTFSIQQRLNRHIAQCNTTREDIRIIQELYDAGHSIKYILQQGYKRYDTDFALRGRRRLISEAVSIVRKEFPIHKTKRQRQHLSRKLKAYYQKHPDKLPYRQRHSSNVSFIEEMLLAELQRQNITGFVKHYRFGVYEYDIAFPREQIDIEIDGHTHRRSDIIKKDRLRDKWSIAQGWKVIRFEASYVKNNLQDCVVKIHDAINNVGKLPNVKNYVYLRKISDRKKTEKKQRMIDDCNKLKQFRFKILQSVKKQHGWITELAELWNVSHTHVRRILKRDFPEFAGV